MALSLAEAAKLSNDVVLAGVIETTISYDPLLGNLLPWQKVEGNAITYNRENAAATVAWRAVGDTWTEDTPTFTQVTASLAIVGGDADVDNYIQLTRSNVQDIAATALQLKAKALAYDISDKIVYGSGAANQPSGLHVLMPAAQQLHQGAGAVGAALSLANLDTLVDLIRPRPDVLMMNRNVRRRLSQYARGNGSPVVFPIDMFGVQVYTYGGIPIVVNDFMTQTETIASGAYTAKTGGATSSIFALRFGEADGFAMGYGGPSPIQLETIGTLETKDATRHRVKSYCTPLLFSTLAVARLDGITDVAAVA